MRNVDEILDEFDLVTNLGPSKNRDQAFVGIIGE